MTSRKRRHRIIWSLVAIFLGGGIALILWHDLSREFEGTAQSLSELRERTETKLGLPKLPHDERFSFQQTMWPRWRLDISGTCEEQAWIDWAIQYGSIGGEYKGNSNTPTNYYANFTIESKHYVCEFDVASKAWTITVIAAGH